MVLKIFALLRLYANAHNNIDLKLIKKYSVLYIYIEKTMSSLPMLFLQKCKKVPVFFSMVRYKVNIDLNRYGQLRLRAITISQ